MPDYDEKSPYVTDIIPHRSLGPPQFDFERLTRFMSYGFIMSPVQFQWFAFLSRAFPITKQSATMPALQRVCFDQLIFAPVGRSCNILQRQPRANKDKRSGSIFHFHDHHRGWRPTSRDTKVPRRVPSLPESQLLALAGSADPQFQGRSPAVPDRESLRVAYSYISLTRDLAICLYCWYCLDCLPIPHQFL